MKTTILPVTKSDDLYSIQDKLTWNKSGRVLLKLEGDNSLSSLERNWHYWFDLPRVWVHNLV